MWGSSTMTRPGVRATSTRPVVTRTSSRLLWRDTDVQLPMGRPLLLRQLHHHVIRYLDLSHAVALLSDGADVAQGRGLTPLGPFAHRFPDMFQPEIVPRLSGVHLHLGEVGGHLQIGQCDVEANRRYHPQNRPFTYLNRPSSPTALADRGADLLGQPPDQDLGDTTG